MTNITIVWSPITNYTVYYIGTKFYIKLSFCRKLNRTYSQVGEVFKQSPAVVINAVVLQDKQLAYVPGSDVTGNLYCSAGMIFIIDFDYLHQKG